MKSMVLSAALATAVTAAFAVSPALASDKCNVPQAEWQPKEALQQKLEGEGWKVKKLKVDDGCYEVYVTDGQGKRMEVYFDPKTFATVKSKSES